MKIYRAYYDSRNFSFEAFSKTENSARYHCKQALLKHGEQCNLDPNWFMIGDSDAIECDQYQLEYPYRDRSIIK
jgi:hypothetical protein